MNDRSRETALRATWRRRGSSKAGGILSDPAAVEREVQPITHATPLNDWRQT